jgi:hypothetical protein
LPSEHFRDRDLGADIHWDLRQSSASSHGQVTPDFLKRIALEATRKMVMNHGKWPN